MYCCIFLPDCNQNRTENTVKMLKYPFSYAEYLHTKWHQRQTFERHNVIATRNVFREKKDRRNALEPLKLIKSLNIVIVKIKKLIDYFISSFTRLSI